MRRPAPAGHDQRPIRGRTKDLRDGSTIGGGKFGATQSAAWPNWSTLLTTDIDGIVLVRSRESAQVSERSPQTAASSTFDLRRWRRALGVIKNDPERAALNADELKGCNVAHFSLA
jgi:hypothetical protein